MSVDAFTIRIPQAAIDDLHARLAATRWPEDPDNEHWEYGTQLTFLRSAVDYWQSAFNWREVEHRLNSLPQFTTEVDGLTIHFAHIRGTGANSAPLLLTHGWPGCFAEMVRIAALLTDPAGHGFAGQLPFDLVIPSLPGFGFSAAPRHGGINTRAIAVMWHELMRRLGYARYFAQGGDIGAAVTTWLARLYPDDVRGIHLNFIPSGYQPYTGDRSRPYSDTESRWLAARAKWVETEGAYAHVQRTKPQSLAYALTDSPVGLAAWTLEKFRSWSDCKGDLLSRFTLDELFTNVSIYWFSGNVGASLRIYKENQESFIALSEGERLRVPMAYALFPKEICPPPREWVERGYHLTRWTEMPSGGHFAAMEEPALLAREVFAAFASLR